MDQARMNSEVKRCVAVLKTGGIILYPTDTIWGIGCDATNPDAVAKIFALKNRPDSKSMIVLLDQSVRLPAYVAEVPEQAYQLTELSEQPLTLVLDGGKNLAPALFASDGTIGIRVTKDEFCRRLVGGLGKPVVSTSANRSGEPSPSNFYEISTEIRSGVDYIAEWRREETGRQKPSVVIKLGTDGVFRFLRK